jgi:signal transduction histidine kinase
MPAGYEDALLRYWARGDPPAGPDLTAFRAAVEAGRRVFVPNARATLLADPDLGDLHPLVRHVTWEGILALPLRGAGTLQGSLDICFPLGRRPAEDEIDFLAAVAAQAAVGVENARLVRAERTRAAGEERQRLARDLHDSVSQALFSMTLHARAAQLAMDRAELSADSPLGRAVGELRSLAHGALAEMRALIFELRPGALAEEGLVAALTKQAAALTAREGLPIAVHGPQRRPALPADTEEQLYRIALEAVHNVLKHADAQHAEVRLAADDGLVLTVTDDGRGFHVTDARPGHLGLGTMGQRAESIGARLEVASRPGQGTIVTVTLPCPPSEE